MTVQELVSALFLEIATGADHLDREVKGGYASDLLSCVLASAQEGNVWVTLQAHINVIAVAALLDLACVIITEGTRPDQAMLDSASEQGIPTLMSRESTFAVVGKLYQLGIGNPS
ncbi:MAG: hypothetical protein A2Y73_04915 [Chloroflexi bacterium RBG_13_56_8]|nr:MAG: hypothetical protein A2Y73_04915 [Chloroflexi bacterium RBG_13_56_8]